MKLNNNFILYRILPKHRNRTSMVGTGTKTMTASITTPAQSTQTIYRRFWKVAEVSSSENTLKRGVSPGGEMESRAIMSSHQHILHDVHNDVCTRPPGHANVCSCAGTSNIRFHGRRPNFHYWGFQQTVYMKHYVVLC